MDDNVQIFFLFMHLQEAKKEEDNLHFFGMNLSCIVGMETNNRICERNKMGLVQFMWNSFFFLGGWGGGGLLYNQDTFYIG